MHPGTLVINANLDGYGQSILRHDHTGLEWVISQMAVSCSVANAVFSIACTINNLPAMTPTLVQNGAAAQGDPTINLGASEQMEITVSSAPPSSKIYVAYYYVERPVQ